MNGDVFGQTVGPDDVLVVQYEDNYWPSQEELVRLATQVPERLRGRTVIIATPMDKLTVTVESRDTVVHQLRHCLIRLEGLAEVEALDNIAGLFTKWREHEHVDAHEFAAYVLDAIKWPTADAPIDAVVVPLPLG